jgi:hypothetical protein
MSEEQNLGDLSKNNGADALDNDEDKDEDKTEHGVDEGDNQDTITQEHILGARNMRPDGKSRLPLELEYTQLSESYHKTRDIRFKLLAFLPLTTSGVFLLLKQYASTKMLFPIGLYGMVVTLGLYIYEKLNMQMLHRMIQRGVTLERRNYYIRDPKTDQLIKPKAKTDSSQEGPFQIRHRYLNGPISSGAAAAYIYGSTFFAWCVISYTGLGCFIEVIPSVSPWILLRGPLYFLPVLIIAVGCVSLIVSSKSAG